MKIFGGEFWGALIFISLICVNSSAQPGPGASGPTLPLNIWPFSTTNWLTADGHSPLAYTNLVLATNGSGNTSVFIDSTNPALLQYAIVETDGHTNFVVNGDGTVSFWFNPSWSSADRAGGYGPGGYGRLLEIGAYTTNAEQGWWSLFVSPDGKSIFFSAEDTNGVVTNYLTAPISWSAGTWHSLALAFSATNNSALYCDGILLTNGAATTLLPGPMALTNGFFIGSDATGSTTNQAHGAFDDLYTYNTAVGSNYLHGLFEMFGLVEYGLTNFTSSAPSDLVLPSETNTFLAVTGPGYLQWAGAASNVTTGGRVYLTNTFAFPSTNFTTIFGFSIAGGTNGVPYDVFGTTELTIGGVATNSQWYWLGQGYTSNIYFLTNQPSLTAFYVLGTPQDSDGDGLSDAYENLVSHTDPNNPDTSYSGLGDGWYVAYGLNPLAPSGVPNMRLGYWRFNTNSWIGEESQLPTLATNLALVPSWSSNAVQVDNGSSANLRYADFNSQYGMENINCRSGTVRFWVNSDWNSGSGPGAIAHLLELGDNTGSGGYWSLSVSADGTQLYFQTATNGVTTTYFTSTISWTSNSWHQLTLTYAPGTNGATIIYVDGVQAASGPAITGWPSAAARAANGLNIGSGRTGSGQSRASFDELETFNYQLSGEAITNDYQGIFVLSPVPVISFTNLYVATTATTASLSGEAGLMAALVDSTNFASATWMIYNTNLTINLGTNEGWHDVWIGFRSISSNSIQSWQRFRFDLELTAPAVVVTNPVPGVVARPIIQLQGYVSQELASFTYCISNSTGATGNQPVAITGQFADTNSFGFTSNYFQAYDLPLANGTNVIKLHATDLAGNSTDTNFIFTLDFSTDTNAPIITVTYPLTNSLIAATNFTLLGYLDDDTASLIVSNNDGSQTVSALVERGGAFSANLDLPALTNAFTIIATDAATNVSSKQITVIQSSLALTVTTPAPDELSQSTFTLTGTISDPTQSVWVNGIQATVSDNDWSITLNTPGGPGLALVVQAGPDLSTSEGELSAYVPMPPVVQISGFMESDSFSRFTTFCPDQEGDDNALNTHSVGWALNEGGFETSSDGSSSFWSTNWPGTIAWQNRAAQLTSMVHHCADFPDLVTGTASSSVYAGSKLQLSVGDLGRIGAPEVIRLTASAIPYVSSGFITDPGDGTPFEGSQIQLFGQRLTDTDTNANVGCLWVSNLLSGSTVDVPYAVLDSGGNPLANYSISICAEAPRLLSLTVVSNAVQVVGTNNWVSIKTNTEDWVYLQATLSMTNSNAAYALHWTNGEPVPGNPYQRRVSRTNSVETTVTASVGSSNLSANIWIMWGRISYTFSGSIDPDDQLDFDTVFGSWTPDPTDAGPFIGPTTTITNAIPLLVACTKVEIIGTLTPEGIGVLLTNTDSPFKFTFTHQKLTQNVWLGETNSPPYVPTNQPPPASFPGAGIVLGNDGVLPREQTIPIHDKIFTMDTPGEQRQSPWLSYGAQAANFTDFIYVNGPDGQIVSDPGYWYSHVRATFYITNVTADKCISGTGSPTIPTTWGDSAW